MWLLHVYEGKKLVEWLFYTEQETKEWIAKQKPVQFSVRYVRIFKG